MIDPRLLDDFMRRFFGYGSWDAKLWFIGMEEGGGESIEEIARRLTSWDRNDDLTDIRQYHAAVGGMPWFSARPKIQSTWGKLIRVALSARGLKTDIESVRRYQRDLLGRRSGLEALIELLPLPSPSTAHWLYQSFGIPGIATRERYRDTMLPLRIAAIRQRIERHHPDTVVFYGIGYRPQWEAIIRKWFAPLSGERFETASDGATRFVLAPHPVATGVSNADFEAIGKWIRDKQ
jgi:hypothetical protein